MTARARVTVKIFRLNQSQRVAERRRLLALGIYGP